MAASRQRPNMSRMNSSAARTARGAQYQYGSAARRLQEPQRPRPRKRPAAQKRPKARMVLAPTSILCMLAAACMLLLVLCAYVELYETNTQVSDLEDELAQLQQSGERLQSTYDSQLDLNNIEEKSQALGMSLPNSQQTVYLNLKGTDHAVVLENEEPGFFEKVVQAISGSVHKLMEYLR